MNIQRGDRVSDEGEQVIIKNAQLVPNGEKDKRLVALITAQKSNGDLVKATSDKFTPCEGLNYEN